MASRRTGPAVTSPISIQCAIRWSPETLWPATRMPSSARAVSRRQSPAPLRGWVPDCPARAPATRRGGGRGGYTSGMCDDATIAQQPLSDWGGTIVDRSGLGARAAELLPEAGRMGLQGGQAVAEMVIVLPDQVGGHQRVEHQDADDVQGRDGGRGHRRHFDGVAPVHSFTIR